jgi:glutamine synthetase
VHLAEARAVSIGRPGFVARHGLRSVEQSEAADRVLQLAQENNLQTIRLSFVDQHGVLRGKSITTHGLQAALQNGCTITTTLLAKDTSHRTVYPVWEPGGGLAIDAMTGGGDFVMVPDPTTFKVLPWAGDCGWLLCDIYFQNGEPVPFSTRRICQLALQRLSDAGFDYFSGLELEFHVFRLKETKLDPEHATQPGAAPDFSLLTQGYQYLTEARLDEFEPVFELLRSQLQALDLPLRSMEIEFGPSQCEFTFQPQPGIATADNTVLFRSAVKQICQRNGLHATFMCRPLGANLFSSGWHLHQSLLHADTGVNALMPDDDTALLSSVGDRFVSGLLKHAAAACVFTTPTINGYKRYKPFSLAPDRAIAARDNRGAMVRIVGGHQDPGTRIENRVGDPAANSYLYLASQIVSGLIGIDNQYPSSTYSSTPYDSDAEMLPTDLMAAVAALRRDDTFRHAMGDSFVGYLLGIKDAEIARYLACVSDWEQREYFSTF